MKISKVGLDLENKIYYGSLADSHDMGEPDCVILSISDTHRNLLDRFSGEIICYLDFIDSLDESLELFKKIHEIKKPINTVILSSKFKVEDINDDFIKKFDNIGIQCPKNLESWKTKLGDKFKFIYIPLCVLDFDLETITEAQKLGLEIYGYNPMGGYINAPRLIQAFTFQYLLGFAATYSDCVVIGGHNLVYSYQDINYLRSLLDKKDDPIYSLAKSVHKLISPIKPVVSTSLLIDNDVYIPCSLSIDNVISDSDLLKLTLGKKKETKEKEDWISLKTKFDDYESLKDFEKEVSAYIDTLKYPSDATSDFKIIMAREKVREYLGKKFSNVMVERIFSKMYIFTAYHPGKMKGFWLWKKMIEPPYTETFILVQDDDNKIYFRERKL